MRTIPENIAPRTTYVVLREEGEGTDVHYVPIAEVTAVGGRQAIEAAVEILGEDANVDDIYVAVPTRSFRRERPRVERKISATWEEVGRGVADLLDEDEDGEEPPAPPKRRR